MRRGGIGRQALALLLGIGLAVPALAGDPSDEGQPRSGLNIHWASWLQDSSRPKKKNQPAIRPKGSAPKPAPPKRTSAADRNSAEREREARAFLRRVAVCDELRRVAQDTRDEALERRAEQLERRAWAIYNQHTAHLPGHNVDVTADERTLHRHLGSADAGGTDLYRASGSDRGGQVAVGEGKP